MDESETRLIYTSCGMGPIGENIRGKIKWYKNINKNESPDYPIISISFLLHST